MITEQELDALNWHKSDKGYNNGDDFEIARVGSGNIFGKSEWALYYCCEVEGRGELVKVVKDIEDLRDTYFLVSGNELEN